MTEKAIHGAKGGGGSQHTPKEQDDNLLSVAKAKVLVALGEGEFDGQLDGKSIFLDGTPLVNADGSENFPGVKWEFRPGTQAQEYIQGIPGAENEFPLTNMQITTEKGWTRTFDDATLSAVRLRIKWPQLFEQKDNGDMVGYTLEYVVEMQVDGGSWQQVLKTAVSGKTTSGYERSHRIDLPAGKTWNLRLRRLTPNANSARIGDTMMLESYTTIIDAKLRYPNTALLYMEFDSSQFNGSIPQISCEPRGRVIRVPANYDPDTRSYTGTWDGTFKWAWTDNPAWVFYDLVITDRFGLGDRLDADNVDKWALYQVAQYCDQMVPDGRGGDGKEPRYMCNVYVQSRADAFTVLRDFAAIFRGMTYWGGDQLVTLADMPRDVDYVYTRANVVEGRFTYASSTLKARYSTALVSWSDPDNQYADAMEPVFEPDLVNRYGVNQLEITAIGCTRQSEANRKGRWGILTNNRDRIVTFAVGLDGNIPLPGYIIAVADEMLSGRVMGGRISAVDGRTVTLDRVPAAKKDDRLLVNLPDGTVQARTIAAVSGKAVTVTAAWETTPDAGACWMIESDDLYAQQYRVTSVTDNGDGTYTISAAWHDPDKYERIDTGAIIDERPISVVPPGHVAAPQNVKIESFTVINQGMAIQTLHATWDAVEGAIAYEAQWRRDNNNWVNIPRSSVCGFDIDGIYAGDYLVRARAINAVEVSSVWGYSELTTLTGKLGNPPKPVNFSAESLNWGVRLTWGFPADTSDTLKTEIQYAVNGDTENPLLLADVPYPQRDYSQLGLKAGERFMYRAQLVDRTGNESGWTDWIDGMANDQASDYLEDIADDFLTKEDGEALVSQITLDPEAILQNALSSHDTVKQQWKQYGKNRAGIILAQTLASDASKSVAALETTVNAKFEDFEATASRLEKATADNTSAISEINDTVVAQFGEVAAAVEGKMDAYVDANGGSAIYTMKTGVEYKGKYYDAGMSVAVTINGAQVDTRFAVNANQFVVMSGSGDNRYSPFAVVNGQVFMNSAFIQDGTITNAKIGAFIQSNDYVAGKTGWTINKSGAAEFNNVTVRGTIVATEGRFSMTGAGNTVVINGNGVTVNLANGGRIILGTW
ncbi:host specificity protein J [Cronobacter sakazakii]|uniref:tail protein n=1 Tax=Cronobacter phage phiES15 TaxID=1168280 RepID=UPI00025F6877|nr:host specificity protein J [Cronobacter sakazakii]YP_006590053.1 tail protein [Cronobacter phage phiES15]AFH14970.1 putative host specificity protein [Cronobacter phage phiES15]AFJ98478.1 putative phage host specificity protein [Cronobacter sakazakii ES15]